MLRDNADVRQSSYFDLGQPVLKVEVEVKKNLIIFW